MLFMGGEKKVALRSVARGVPHSIVESREKANRVQRQSNVQSGGKLRPHAAHALAGRALALMALPLKHDHIPAASFGQVVGDARPDNSTADDNDIRSLAHELLGSINLTNPPFPGSQLPA